MKMMKHSKRHQHGAVLIVSMLLLLVMTILALSMSQTTTLQERMAGNARDSSAAFEGAEAALRAGEEHVKGFIGQPYTCTVVGECVDLDKSALNGVVVSEEDDDWWNKAGTTFGTPAKDMDKLAEDPVYVVRRIGTKDGGTIAKGKAGTTSTTEYWEISARSKGLTDTSESVVQSTYAITP